MTTTPEALADAAFENWNAPDLWSGKDDPDLQDRRAAFRAGYLTALRSAPGPGGMFGEDPAELTEAGRSYLSSLGGSDGR